MSHHEGFVITGFGRSGTKFLSELMNRSPSWTVRHEPRGASDLHQTDPSRLEPLFLGHYGEVNSYLRRIVGRLHGLRRGIILRHPWDVMVSVMHRKSRREWPLHAVDITRAYLHFDRLLDTGEVELVLFSKMTGDVAYLQALLHRFGVDDVEVRETDLATPVHATKPRRWTRSDIPWWCAPPLHRVRFMVKKYGL